MILYPPNFYLESQSFPKVWEQAVQFCMKNGMIIKPEENAKQLTRDICSKIILTGNGIRDIFSRNLHPKFPTKAMFCNQYITEYTREWIAEQKLRPEEEQFVYNYMGRLIERTVDGISLDQIKQLRKNLIYQ